MGLIIFLQGCEKMKINEVKELLAGTPTCEQLAELKADERSGVQKLLAAYYKRLEKAAQEKERFTKMLSYEKKYYAQGIQYVAGVDEAGRGPLAGPLVIAAVILPQDVFISGLNDSKQLSAAKRDKLYDEVLAQAVAIEVSSLGLKHGRVDGIDFECAVFSNLSPDHIGEFEHDSFEEYAYWKSVLFERCHTAVMNFDDEAYRIMKKNCQCPVISYGLDSGYDISAKNVTEIRTRTEMGIGFYACESSEAFRVTAPLPGTFNVYNILAALGVVKAMGLSPQKAADSLKSIRIAGRAEIVDVDADFDVIIDRLRSQRS